MKAAVLAVALAALTMTSARAQLDLNNQAITRQNPINSPLPPPPAAPLPVPGSGMPAVGGGSVVLPRSSVRVPRVTPIDRDTERAEQPRAKHTKASRHTVKRTMDRDAPATKSSKQPQVSDRIPSICRGC
jgi:hypothetical protein